jgi:NADH-quinone oxidoreductase subunit E
MGTACHVKGAVEILQALEGMLGIQSDTSEDGKFSITTEDRKFTLEIARCFGACSMAPVLRVDGTLYGYATREDLPAILAEYGWKP